MTKEQLGEFAMKLSDLELEWKAIKADVETRLTAMRTAIKKESVGAHTVVERKKRIVLTEQSGNFPFPVGKIVQVAFPELFRRRLVSAGDVAYLLSPRATKDFRIKGHFPILRVYTRDDDPALFSNNFMRYYKKLRLEFGGKKYHLCSQFRPNSRKVVLNWIFARGLKRQELLDLMSGK